jgi:1-acyl-sn-glycerol-3-phosphate acyltransferase
MHYLATAALFRNPLIARFLVALGVIPVHLKADDPDQMNRNLEIRGMSAGLRSRAARRYLSRRRHSRGGARCSGSRQRSADRARL